MDQFKSNTLKNRMMPQMLKATRKMNLARATQWLGEKFVAAATKGFTLTSVTFTDAITQLEITEAELKHLIKATAIMTVGLTSQGIRVIPANEFDQFLSHLQ